ncbi:MAG: anthranilate synthase component I family protein [Spirochaetes bacterium]|nr:anthranilate synthase component I family protein [Spirochaetota bacterium]
MFNFENKQPARIKYKKISADKVTPIIILESLNAVALLETAYHETGRGKYSLMIIDEAFTILKKYQKVYLRTKDKKSYAINSRLEHFLEILEEFRSRAPDPQELSEIPLPLGGLGFLGYEFYDEIEDIKFENIDDRNIYDCAFIFGRNFIIFDHLHDQIVLVSVSYQHEEQSIDLDGQIKNIEERILRAISQKVHKNSNNIQAKIISEDDRQDYIEMVKKVKDEIYQGNLLQCVVSRRIKIETKVHPITIYRNLRSSNPSPYMFYLNFKTFVLFGASPEVMVKYNKETIYLRPIAGTRPRGKDQAEDLKLEQELLNDEKEKAEHLMLIDLARNDVGKVSKGGTVVVTEEMVIERYSKVMHMVSEVQGQFNPQYSQHEIINATIPAGTVSGAPKIQAIKTIEKLEKYKRGPYAGVIGYFEKNGSFDTCIAIRTAICKGNKIWLQAGAGIVYDSIPEKEYEETQNKMMALLNALNITVIDKK